MARPNPTDPPRPRKTTSSTPDSYGPLSEKPEVRSEATQVAVDRYLGGQSGGGRS